MEGISTDLGKTFVEKLINGVIGKSRYLFCYKCIANEFELEKEKLEAEWETMTLRFTKAKEKGKDIQSNAQFWEKQANKLIQENTKLKQRCFFGFCPDCIWLYKRGEELTNKTEEIKKLMVKGEKLENVELTRSLPDVERYSSQSYISFKTRESKYNELLNALKDDSYYTIGLHGMGGTGKTTMAKEVGKQLKTSMQFNRVIFTTVSNTPNIKKIQDDIAGHLELEWRATNESTRPTQLWDRLTNGEKILVILDDVWDDLNFEDIGIPNSDNHKGCKVLVTTRYFKGCKIARECKGLPIAIATIARSLKGEKRQENWDAALNSLQNPMLMAGVDDTKLEGSTSGKTAAEPSLSTIFETKNEPPIQSDVAPKQKGIKLSSEDGITSANAKTITSSTHSKSANSLGPTATSSLEYGDGQIVVASPPISLTKTLNDDQGDPSQIDEKEDGDDQIATAFFIATTETNNQVSRNDDALKKVSSNIKDQFPKNNEETISKSPVPSQFPLVPSKGDPSQKVEELSSSLLVMRELEQLVTKKHLDDENLCLLNDFLVNHPSVLLRDTSLSNKYKGYAYNCLAELLKFLKTHSVLEVLGSCKTEFVELLQDARSFAFDKDWFDGIERRTLFPDLQVSQDVLKNLSVSKQQVTKDVEVLRLKIEDLKHQLTSSEAVLENIIQQEAALSAPIGY
ncbi:uncharacterized protein LOC123916122 isoform X2 [Trifolium pratense]|uniref:uncharacterized protein LOC123916122 isoform X2 n=1 Tax=Trifolium pratense TaxID=57577 RepID=UPI001E69694D|nr:uncharacterized protein LOC123916122 isoform X2 [Trifolium pratense]